MDWDRPKDHLAVSCSVRNFGTVTLLPELLTGVILIEGNLISEDCGLMSRKIAQAVDDKSVEKIKYNIVDDCRASPRAGLKQWADDGSGQDIAGLREKFGGAFR